MDIKSIGIGIIIGVIILFIVLLIIGSGSNKTLGTENNPYNSSIGYQGQGYYVNVLGQSGITYISSNVQFQDYYATTSSVQTTIPVTVAATSTTILSCQSGYIVGSDGLCHPECGNETAGGLIIPAYCPNGSSCYNNKCISCPSGYYVGENGLCYSGASTIATTTIQQYITTTTINQGGGTAGLQNQCSVTGSHSSYSGSTTLIANGQTCELESNYYFTSTFTTYGPSQILGAFSTSGGAIDAYVVSQSELASYKETDSITSYQCTLGSVITGSINCEVPAGNWSILLINKGMETSTISFTSDVNVSYVTYAEETPFEIIDSGASWSLSPNYHEYESFNLNSVALITGGFSSSGTVTGYVMNAAEFATFNQTGTATNYQCTTGDVISGSVGCAVPAGEWYFVLVNPSANGGASINWENGLTAYGLLNGTTNYAGYDEQFGLTFADSYTTLAYNVTAVAQVDPSGTGPSYLLNGYSNTGYWYQVGVSYNWVSLDSTQHQNGFNINYEVFAPDGTSVDPSSGGGGFISLSGPIHNGDTVQLSLYFSNGDVVMKAYDPNTGASGYVIYSDEGASEFVGNPAGTATNGFFTGLMTEWYHVEPWYGGGNLVSYNPYGAVNSPAWLWVDEFYCYTSPCGGQTGSISLFYNATSTYINPGYKYETNGATLDYLSGGEFTTGS